MKGFAVLTPPTPLIFLIFHRGCFSLVAAEVPHRACGGSAAAMIPLGGMPGAAGDGGAGLAADVDNHIGALAGAILAGTAVDVIRGLAVGRRGGEGDDVIVSLGNSLSERTASVGERLVDRELNRRPTLTAKPEEMAVQVTRPIDLEPYRD